MTRQEILWMRCGVNQVIVQLDRKQDEYLMGSGKKLYLDTSFEPERHAPVTGTIVNICTELFFNQIPGNPTSMKWDTDIELQIGDYVVSYYLVSINALKEQDGRILTDQNDNQYLFLRYDQIFAGRRNGKIITCNGQNLLTPVPDPQVLRLEQGLKAAGMLHPFKDTKGSSHKMARMKYPAKPNRRYRDPRSYDFEDPIDVGELVLVRRNGLLPLEYELHAGFEGKQVLYRVQREFIYAIADERVLSG